MSTITARKQKCKQRYFYDDHEAEMKENRNSLVLLIAASFAFWKGDIALIGMRENVSNNKSSLIKINNNPSVISL
jgi:hypothetical protein